MDKLDESPQSRLAPCQFLLHKVASLDCNDPNANAFGSFILQYIPQYPPADISKSYKADSA